MNKKGQSEFVAYTLLIGMAVTLAVLVGTWSFKNAQSTSDTIVRQSNIEEKCDQISIGGFAVKEGCPSTIPTKINVSNRGNIIINELKVSNGETGTECLPAGSITDLKPGISSTKALNNCNTAVILPLVKISNEEIVGCSEKKLVLKLVC